MVLDCIKEVLMDTHRVIKGFSFQSSPENVIEYYKTSEHTVSANAVSIVCYIDISFRLLKRTHGSNNIHTRS
jgi:hypothetical protein